MLVGGLLIAALVGLPLAGPSTYVLGFLLLLFMYAALAASWNIVGGFTGYLSFGHAAFFGLGAYTTALLLFYLGWSPFLTFPLAGALAAGFALIVGYPCLRLRGPYFSLITLVLALALNTLALNLPFTQGATGLFLPFPPVDIYTNHVIFYEAMLGLMLLATLTLRWIDRSKLGVGLAAIRADEDVAQALGVNATGLKLLAFVLSAFLTGMVGGIFAYYQSFLDPTFVLATAISINIALMALFGGRASWLGPLLGAAVLTLVNESLVVSVGAQPARIAFGLLLMLVILFMPEGLMALAPALMRRLH
jgi:branched-chain amino acid transport system permease protein